MKKPETKLVEKIMTRLRAEGGLWFKVHGGPFQLAGISDILGCYRGRFIAIEIKVPGGEPTDLQWDFIYKVQSAGGRAWYATSVEEALEVRDGRRCKR